MIHELLVSSSDTEQSILIPAVYDIFWGTISFLILLALFAKFVLPMLNKVMAERTEKIEGGIARAKVMQEEAARARDSYQAQLADANAAAAQIRTAARGEGEQIVAEARGSAQTVAALVTARADAQLMADRDAAVDSLKRDVGELAVALASKIVGESLTDDARAKATVDRFIAELEANAAGAAGVSSS